jgi:ribosomal protein S18 acetylase RimI-like enzyme
MADFRFTNEHTQSELGNVTDIIERPRLWIPSVVDYPNYYDWTEKVEAEINTGQKRAMLAYSGREAIGTVVYQRHQELTGVVEIKNISVSPDSRGRYVGSFLLRNVELEATNQDYPECDEVLVDTKVTNGEMISFLLKHGYKLKEVEDLYDLGTALDAVFYKSLS